MKVTIKTWSKHALNRMPLVDLKLIKQQTAVPNLEQLIAGITSENLQPAVDFGPPVGRELL